MLAEGLGQIYRVHLILLTYFLQQSNSLKGHETTGTTVGLQQWKAQTNVSHVAGSSHELWCVTSVLMVYFSC